MLKYKIGVVICGLVFCLASLGHADAPNRLKSGSESKDGAYGLNDVIPENAFKNNMKEQGYTAVYDIMPEDLEVTEVHYMGKLGNPTKEDTDYVLTSEYKALNAAEQNKRINEITNRIDNYEKIISDALSKKGKNLSLIDFKKEVTSIDCNKDSMKVIFKIINSNVDKRIDILEKKIRELEK